MKRGLTATLVGLAIGLGSVSAYAQAQICGDHEDLIKRLKSDYTEDRKGIGLTADGRVVELFTSPDGSWTLLLTGAEGTACLVTHGKYWQPVPVKDSRPIY
jgi:hypothetical protein